MLQYNENELSDLVNKASLQDEDRKPFSGNENRNRRRGINSHLYSKPNSGRGGRGRGSPNNRSDDSNQQNRQNRGRGGRGNISNNPQEQDRQENDDNLSSYKTFPAGSLKFQANTEPYNPPPPQRYDPVNGSKSQKKRNTETFKPSHKPTDLRITAAFGDSKKYTKEITSRDVIVVHGLFCEESDLNIYNKLLDETNNSGIDFSSLWQLWHGDTHLIADDKKDWKDSCPTFKMVLEKVENYFDMDIQATRLNWYRDSSEWKPFHHDAAAINPEKAKVQNFTVAVSFGAERDVAFEHATARTVISMPQPNGTIYTFGKDVNVMWRHGILQVPPDKFHDKGRISIIAWGSVRQTQV